MSICSGRYASKSIQRLNKLCSSPTAPVSPSSAGSQSQQPFQPSDSLRPPLLFLYPQWFRHSWARQYHTERDSGEDRSGTNQHQSGAARKRWPKQSHAIARKAHSSLADGQISHLVQDGTEPEMLRAPLQQQDFSGPRKILIQRQPGGLGRVERKKIAAAAGPKAVLAKASPRKAGHGSTRTTLESPNFPTLLYRTVPEAEVDALSMCERSKISNAGNKERQYFRESKIQIGPLLPALESALKSHPIMTEGASRFSLSAATIRALAGTDESNMWIHHDGGGCAVTVTQSHSSKIRTVIVDGTDRARAATVAYLTSLRQSESSISNTARRSPEAYDGINSIPVPSTWSLGKFLQYLSAIISVRPRRSAMRPCYAAEAAHLHKAIGHKLQDLFTHPESRRFASVGALWRSLRFCRQHSELSDIATCLWDEASRLGLRPDVRCFNEEIFRCLVVKNFTRVQHLLLAMKNSGVRPDATTCASLLTFAEDLNLRIRIRKLANDHLLDREPAGKASLIDATVKREIDPFISKSGGLPRFAEQMDHIFGPGWLTSRALKKIIRACRIRTTMADRTAMVVRASEVLEFVLQKYGDVPIDAGCMKELLLIVKKAGNMDNVIEILQSRPMQGVRELPQDIIEELFFLAWRKRRYNLCRLLWSHAAVLGKVTREMQKTVQKSLLTNVSSANSLDGRIWELLAGKIIIGVAGDFEPSSQVFPGLSRSKGWPSPVKCLLQWTPDNGLRHEQMQLGQLLIERDLNAFRTLMPISHPQFMDQLADAVALDSKWDASNAVTTIAPIQLLSESLKIEFERRHLPILEINDIPSRFEKRQKFAVNGHLFSYDDIAFADKFQPSLNQGGSEVVAAADISETCRARSTVSVFQPYPNEESTFAEGLGLAKTETFEGCQPAADQIEDASMTSTKSII